MSTITVWSTNEEFHNDSQEDVLYRLWEDECLNVGAEYYSVEVQERSVATFFCAKRLIEDITESINDECCEDAAESAASDLNPHVAELQALVNEWIGKRTSARAFVPIGKTVVHKVTQEDVDRIESENK